MEEKGSDVNLASHLIHDGWSGQYDVAVLVSNDSDLEEPMRIVTQELRKPIGLVCPHDGKPVVHLARHATLQEDHQANASRACPVPGSDPDLSARVDATGVEGTAGCGAFDTCGTWRRRGHVDGPG